MMPQIPGNKIPEFGKFLKSHGISCKFVQMPLRHLKPTQDEFNQEKIDNLKYDIKNGRQQQPLIVAQKGEILDGHHRFLAAKDLGQSTIAVLYCKTPIANLLKLGHDYDHSFTKKVTEVIFLENVNDIIAHLKERGVDPSKTHVIVDVENKIATFLLYNLSGQLVGYQRYNPNGDKKDRSNSLGAKYYSYISKESPATSKLAVWGLDNVTTKDRILYVTEGIFDAIKIQNAGLPVIAVLGNNPKPLKAWFKALGKHTIAILDDDAAGEKLKNITDDSVVVPGPYKDIGEMPQDVADKFIQSVHKKYESSSKEPDKSTDTSDISSLKVKNPETDNEILVKTALKYDKDTPAYKAAVQAVKKAQK